MSSKWVLTAVFVLVLCPWRVLHAYTPIYSVKKIVSSNDVIPGISAAYLGAPIVTGLTSTGGFIGYFPYIVKKQGQTRDYVEGFYWNNAAQVLTKFDAPTIGASSSMAICANDSGMVAGIFWSSDMANLDEQLGFVWHPDGTLTTFQSPDGSDIDAVIAMNSSGMVIGTYYNSVGLNKRAFVWDGTTSTDLGGDDTWFIWPEAINASGQVVGTAYFEGDAGPPIGGFQITSAFQWQNGTMSSVGGVDIYGASTAAGVNDADGVIGTYMNYGQQYGDPPVSGAFFSSNNTAVDLGSLGGGGTIPFSIDPNGQVTGTTYDQTGALHCFSWQNNVLADLGFVGLGSGSSNFQITSVNQGGDVAGFVGDVSGAVHVFAQTAGGTYDLAAVLSGINGFIPGDSNGTRAIINDSGLIACSGTIQGTPAILLTTPDSDNNGLPDGWEKYYFGYVGVDPYQDKDDDGLTNLQEYLQGSNPTDYYNGQLPTIIAVSGTPQTGPVGGFAPQPLVVQVTDANGVPLVGAPIKFQVDAGLLQASNSAAPANSLFVLTDTNGQIPVFFQLPASANTTCTVTASATSNGQNVSATFTITCDDGTGTFASPFAPTNFVSQGNPDGSLDMSWTNNTDDQTPVEVEIQQADGSWKLVATLTPGTSSYHYVSSQ